MRGDYSVFALQHKTGFKMKMYVSSIREPIDKFSEADLAWVIDSIIALRN